MKKIINLILLAFLTTILISCANTNTDGYIRFVDGDNINHVSGRIFLTTSIDNNDISWESSNLDVVDISNINKVKINRPKEGNKNVKVKLTAITNNKEITFTLTIIALTGDLIYDEYPSLRSKNHIIEEIDYDSLIQMLTTKEQALIYLGFPSCPYCQEYLPYFESKARTLGYEGKIYYYNFSSIRQIIETDGIKHLDSKFLQIVNLLGEEHTVLNNDLPWLYAPTFIGLGGYEVKGVFTGSVLAVEGFHEQHNISIDKLNENQILTLEDKFSTILLDVIDCDC